LSGLGGPISSSRIHFVRTISQSRPGIVDSEPPCSFWQNYFRSPFFCSIWLDPAPNDSITEQLEQRTFFRWLEYRWVLIAAMAVLLYVFGGLTYIVWGLFARLAITANMFACFDYFCHSSKWGHQQFQIDGAACEGRNNAWLGLLTFGEGWHNNHHAMPSSPQMGFRRFEIDFGYAMIRLMQRIGLAWDLVEPAKALKSNARAIGSHDRTISPATAANHHAVEKCRNS
jgi:stearoyl-CoA desaturase (delta-9 desaturase)